jgi:hypothetical protein
MAPGTILASPGRRPGSGAGGGGVLLYFASDEAGGERQTIHT